MDKRRENQLTMIEGIYTILDENADKTAKVPAFAVSLTTFKTDLADLKTYSAASKTAASGKTETEV